MIFFCKGKLYLSPSLFNGFIYISMENMFKKSAFMILIQMKNLEFPEGVFFPEKKKRTSNIW